MTASRRPYSFTHRPEPDGPFRVDRWSPCQKDGCEKDATVQVLGPGNTPYGRYCAAHGARHAAYLNAKAMIGKAP